MLAPLYEIITALRSVFTRRDLLAVCIVLTPAMALLLFLIPVATIPGNSPGLQWHVFQAPDYALLACLAFAESLLITMTIHAVTRRQRVARGMRNISQEGIGMLSVVPAFLFGTKLCPVCIAAVLGFFGPGAIVFAVTYRTWIFAATMLLVLLSIYATARSINGGCQRCR